MKKLLILLLVPVILFLAACQSKTPTPLNPSADEGMKASAKSDVTLTILPPPAQP